MCEEELKPEGTKVVGKFLRKGIVIRSLCSEEEVSEGPFRDYLSIVGFTFPDYSITDGVGHK